MPCSSTALFVAGSLGTQSMSHTPGIAGLYMTLFAPPSSGICGLGGGAGDVALTAGSNASAATWVFYPPLAFFSCTQVRAAYAIFIPSLVCASREASLRCLRRHQL